MKIRFRNPKDPLRKIIGRKKPVLIVGLGRSGSAAANLLADLGCKVVVSEILTESEMGSNLNGLNPDVKVSWGGHPAALFLKFPLIVLSPGVPVETEAVQAALRKGVRVIGEMELAYRLSLLPWVAITGSNGKSTTTTLVGKFAEKTGLAVRVGGNLGIPSAELVREEEGASFIVAEVSSFQLETIETFKPAIGVMLNISPDHLDRYRSEADYIRAKAAIFSNMDKSDVAVVNHTDPEARKMADRIKAQVFPFSRKPLSGDGAVLDGDWMTIREGDNSHRVLEAGKVAMAGSHNLENALAAIAVGHKMGIAPQGMADVLKTFRGLPHRMELVDYYRGIPIYNDSKGTNVGATLRSLECIRGRAILIMGGRDKGAPYAPMRSIVKRKVGLLILIGEAAQKMYEDLGSSAETIISASLDEAVRAALNRARPGDEILFSPACSSFDMFASFEERGEVFKKLVHRYMGIAG